MERLTQKDSNGWYIHDQSIAYDECRRGEEIDLLAAYEDTDLTPEEVERLKEYMQPFTIQDMDRFREIMRAEADGRLVILPCKVTDTVYVIEDVFERKKAIGKQVAPALIDHVTIGGTTGKPVYDLCTETGRWYYSMEPEDFYLTREAAEAALKGQAGQTVENNFKCLADSAGYCQKWLRNCVGWCNCGLKGYGAPCPGCENASPHDNEKCKSCTHIAWKNENYENYLP